ncbi:glycerophosphodiester phosphodiesterase [Cohnella sp. NL03-T5]|nr:glycerophosphodiester phosphodiesterase [Cohnella silvisoli]
MSIVNEVTRAALHPCVAHRGFSGRAPENTLAAFRMAMSQPFVQWIELDVHLSRDNVPVVIHDGTLKRTTNGQGLVREKTAAELGALDAGSWFHASFASEGVPTLEQVVALTSGRCRLNVELKGDAADRDLLARKVVDVVRSYRLEHDTVITSFHPELLSSVRNYYPAMRTGLIIDDRPFNLIPMLTVMGASVLSIGYGRLTPQLLQQSADASIDVMAWTVNSPGDLRRLAKRPEPFQLCTNYPDRWLAAVKEES